jgi:hypothetical protein
MATIGSVITACFMGGMRAYQRVQDFGQVEGDAYIAFEMFERDLVNAVNLPGAEFAGDAENMQFAALKSIAAEDEFVDDVKLVRYRSDMQDGLVRSARGLKDAQFEGEDGLTAGGLDVRFAYSADVCGDEDSWSDVWQSETSLPCRVRVWMQLAPDDEDGVERVVVLPVTGKKREKQR